MVAAAKVVAPPAVRPWQTSRTLESHREIRACHLDQHQSSRARSFRRLAGLLSTVLVAPSRARAARATQPREKANKIALITGASTGIGKATAQELCRSNMYSRIILAGHNEAKTKAAMDEMGPVAQTTELEYLPLGLASFKSVRQAAKQFQDMNLPLHTLICNAAVMALPQRQVSADGNELQLEVNYLSHFLLVNLLMPQLVKAGTDDDPARTVPVEWAKATFFRFLGGSCQAHTCCG